MIYEIYEIYFINNTAHQYLLFKKNGRIFGIYTLCLKPRNAIVTDYIVAVSYTHLDVYKRQVLHSS